MAISACTNCNGKRLFMTRKPVSAGGGHVPNYLPGLARRMTTGKFDIVVCQDCGLTRFFASQEALKKLVTSPNWQRI